MIAQRELERRLHADGQDLDRHFPRADKLELQILARVAVTPRETRRGPTWRQELALAGLFVVVAALLVVGFGRLRALTQPVPARPTPSVRSIPGGFRDVGIQRTYMVSRSDGWMVEGEPYNGLVHTTDGGAHWSRVQPGTDALGLQGGTLASYAIDAAHAWIVASPQNSTTFVNRTADGGRSWSRATIQTPGGFGALGGLFFVDPENGWLLTYMAGVNVPVQSGPLQGALMNIGPVVIYRTTDGGVHWSRLSERVTPISGCEWDRISFVSTTTGWMGVDCVSYPQRAPMLFVTHDGGVTWQAQSQPISRWTCPSGVPIFTDTTHGTAIACDAESRQVLLATSDAGKTWELRPLPFPNVQVGFPPQQIVFSDAMHGWTLRAEQHFGPNGCSAQPLDFYRTDDGGRTWHQIPTNLARQTGGSCVSLSFLDASFGLAWKEDYVTAADHSVTRQTQYLFKTTDGGVTWRLISTCDNRTGQSRCQWTPP